jgi:hypothetical protein
MPGSLRSDARYLREAACPGFIDTPIVETMVMRGPQASPKAREQARSFYRRRGHTAERTAENLLRAVLRRVGARMRRELGSSAP